MFLKTKRGEVKESAARAYEYPTKNFVEYLERHSVENMSDVDGYLIEQWKHTRQGEVAPATYRDNVKKVKTFIGFCERSSLISYGTFDAIDVPTIRASEEASHEKVSHTEAVNIQDYLETYEYASRRHAIFNFLWETGCRVSGLMAVDVSDIGVENGLPYVDFINRPASGTGLKNDKNGERRVTITEDLYELLQDYKAIHRPDTTDEYGRDPLFCTENQRASRQRIYRNLTALTRPCVYTNNCPHGREIAECEAGRAKKKAYACPSAKSMHPVRRGSITHHLNRGWPKQKVSERCDVSLSVLEKHYNEQTKEDERQQRSKYVENL